MENLKEKLAQHEPTFIGMDQCHQTRAIPVHRGRTRNRPP